MNNTILRFPQVIELTKLARSTIYTHIQEGTFPPPVKLGVRAVGWPEQAISDWIQSRIDESQRKII